MLISDLNSLIPITPTCYDNHYSDFQLINKTDFYMNNVADRDVMLIVSSVETSNNKTINIVSKDSVVTPVLGSNNIVNTLVLGGAFYLKAGERITGDIGAVYEVNLVNRRRVS